MRFDQDFGRLEWKEMSTCGKHLSIEVILFTDLVMQASLKVSLGGAAREGCDDGKRSPSS